MASLIYSSLPLQLQKKAGAGRHPSHPLVAPTDVGLYSGGYFCCQPSESFLSRPVTPCRKRFLPVVINLHLSSKTSLKRSGCYSLKINSTGKKQIESAYGVSLPLLFFRQQLRPLSKILETIDLKI
jgi:hypothetical protein